MPLLKVPIADIDRKSSVSFSVEVKVRFWMSGRVGRRSINDNIPYASLNGVVPCAYKDATSTFYDSNILLNGELTDSRENLVVFCVQNEFCSRLKIR